MSDPILKYIPSPPPQLNYIASSLKNKVFLHSFSLICVIITHLTKLLV